MRLTWHKYKYYPYEKDFAVREIKALLSPAGIKEEKAGLLLDRPRFPEAAKRLVYFSQVQNGGGIPHPTQQAMLEQFNGNETSRQSTRYSAHGLHEYKGKFNPQVAKAMLNFFGVKPGQTVFDPFCGSGTSLVECVHVGVQAFGTDINPMAVFLANAKISSLGIPAEDLREESRLVVSRTKWSTWRLGGGGAREEYLLAWFTPEVLADIERLRLSIQSSDKSTMPILLAIASNLLREYSLQDPKDLRIRRRKSPLPKTPFFEAFREGAEKFCSHLQGAQASIGVVSSGSEGVVSDCRSIRHNGSGRFDCAITSPPYATALPYIDTQRLSLVWLDLVSPDSISPLEADLLGSREIRGQSKRAMLDAVMANTAHLPDDEAQLCVQLQNALSEGDGFRRQVVPSLLYRYFSGMSDAFSSIKRLMKKGAKFGLIVGGNHTVLGGNRFDLDTPGHLANLAVSRGWKHEETVALQTYRRYGYHVNNATSREALVVLRA
ncbi:MAG: TRM11 family SAM-dependent methyltransferase [Leptospirillia bacterium]